MTHPHRVSAIRFHSILPPHSQLNRNMALYIVTAGPTSQALTRDWLSCQLMCKPAECSLAWMCLSGMNSNLKSSGSGHVRPVTVRSYAANVLENVKTNFVKSPVPYKITLHQLCSHPSFYFKWFLFRLECSSARFNWLWSIFPNSKVVGGAYCWRHEMSPCLAGYSTRTRFKHAHVAVPYDSGCYAHCLYYYNP